MGRIQLTIDPGAGRGNPRRRIRGARVAAALVLLACAVVALVFVIRAVFPPEAAAPDGPFPSGPEETAIVPAPASPALEVEKIVIPLRSNLADILKRRDFDNLEIHRIKEAVKPVYDLGKIRAGQQLRLASLPGGPWKTLEYDIDQTRFLVVHNNEDGIRAEVKLVPFEIRPAVVWGVIEDSLIGTLEKAGEEDSLAIDLVERCFGWDIDFNTDLRRGDSFRVYVEKKYLDGRFAGYRDILAAEFTNDGNVFQAFRFTYPDTKASDYYD
ncbi:MAG TPA: hypothetical protein VMY15_01300, partial [Candidatus Latescibacteria bacterium]|nr:hypothetical protein [Candidatus Latescibacterota bacterium]